MHDHSLVCTHALEKPSNMFATWVVHRSKGYYASCVISAVPVEGHVYDISVPDSFMYTYIFQPPADMHDLYTVIWLCTGEVLASQMMLLCIAPSGSPHNVLRFNYLTYHKMSATVTMQ